MILQLALALALAAAPVVQTPSGAAPSDAMVLFDGKSLDAWEPADNEGDPRWKVSDGVLLVTPGAGDLRSKAAFGNIQFHLEYRTPIPSQGSGLARGNSGVLFMGRYELQILDSYDNPVTPDVQAAAIYNQHAPLVNASRGPGEWQTLDVLFLAPRPRESSVLAARMTVFHNGVLVQNDAALLGQTTDEDEAIGYERHADKLPLALQEAGSAVEFRNIWVREIAFPGGP